MGLLGISQENQSYIVLDIPTVFMVQSVSFIISMCSVSDGVPGTPCSNCNYMLYFWHLKLQ